MKKMKLGALALALVFGTLSSFTTINNLYWFQPSSQSYIDNSSTDPDPQDEVDRLNGLVIGDPYNQTASGGTLVEEGFDDTHVTVPNEGDPFHQTGIDADEQIFLH